MSLTINVSEDRKHCSPLVATTLKDSIEKYEKKPVKREDDKVCYSKKG